LSARAARNTAYDVVIELIRLALSDIEKADTLLLSFVDGQATNPVVGALVAIAKADLFCAHKLLEKVIAAKAIVNETAVAQLRLVIDEVEQLHQLHINGGDPMAEELERWAKDLSVASNIVIESFALTDQSN